MIIKYNFLGTIKKFFAHSMVNDSIFMSVSQYLSIGIEFVKMILVTRILGPSGYGMVGLVTAYPLLLSSFTNVKTVSITSRYISVFLAINQKDSVRSICKLTYVLDLLTSVTALLFVAATGWWVSGSVYKLHELYYLMLIYALSFPFLSPAGTSRAILLSFQCFRWIAILNILSQVIMFAFVIFFLLLGFAVSGVIFAMVLGSLVNSLTMTCIANHVLHKNDFRHWWSASFKSLEILKKELFSFFSWNYLMVTLTGLISQVPLILLGHFRGAKEVGFYRFAVNIMVSGNSLESSLSNVVYPRLSTRWALGEQESLKRSLKLWTKYGGVFASMIVIITFLLPIIIPVIFGSNYTPAIKSTQILMASNALSLMFFWLISFYYSTGKYNLWVKAYIVYTTLYITLGLLVAERWGCIGLAVLTTSTKVIFSLIMISFVVTKWEIFVKRPVSETN